MYRIYLQEYLYTCTLTNTSTNTQAYIHTQMYTHTDAHKHTLMYLHTDAQKHTLMYVHNMYTIKNGHNQKYQKYFPFFTKYNENIFLDKLE